MVDKLRWLALLAPLAPAIANAQTTTPNAQVPAAPAATEPDLGPLPPPPGPPPPPPPAPAQRVALQAAVRQALAQNPSVRVAIDEVRRAEALVRQARSQSLPTLVGNGTYTRLDADRVLGGRVIQGANSLNANVLLTVPLIAPQRWANWGRADDQVDVAKVSSADARRQVAIATARAYLAIVSQRRVLDVGERARETARAHYEYASTRFGGGVGNRIDVVRAQQEFETDAAQVEAAQSALVRAQEALGVLLGAGGPVDAAEEPALPDGPPLSNAESDVANTRADLRALETRARAARRSVDRDWTDYAPYLVGTFMPFYQNPPSLVQPETGWQAQLILTVPFYDGGLRYGQAEEREALAAEARSSLDAALRQAKADVRAAFESMRRADDSLGSARNAARLAAEALKLANLAYRAGATTNLEVIDAERRARDAETAVAVAEDAARQARLDFLVASGRFPGE